MLHDFGAQSAYVMPLQGFGTIQPGSYGCVLETVANPFNIPMGILLGPIPGAATASQSGQAQQAQNEAYENKLLHGLHSRPHLGGFEKAPAESCTACTYKCPDLSMRDEKGSEVDQPLQLVGGSAGLAGAQVCQKVCQMPQRQRRFFHAFVLVSLMPRSIRERV